MGGVVAGDGSRPINFKPARGGGGPQWKRPRPRMQQCSSVHPSHLSPVYLPLSVSRPPSRSVPLPLSRPSPSFPSPSAPSLSTYAAPHSQSPRCPNERAPLRTRRARAHTHTHLPPPPPPPGGLQLGAARPQEGAHLGPRERPGLPHRDEGEPRRRRRRPFAQARKRARAHSRRAPARKRAIAHKTHQLARARTHTKLQSQSLS